MQLAAGTQLGRYRVQSLLGAGGMGEVYLAHDSTLGRSVAIKLLRWDVAHDRDRLRRFEQEARAASSLNHPNILTIHETGVHDDTPFVATEFVDGESLRQRMTRSRLDLREVLNIAVQVASALAAAHAAEIVHRDIKPENIMVRKDGIVKVVDFGLAKLVSRSNGDVADAPTKGASNTGAGVILGTIQYMSPEQVRGLETDLRTDIWSLGVVLYELLAGRPTFEDRTSGDVVAAILRNEPQPLTIYVPDAPPELVRIVTKALQKDREERYQDAKDLAVDLKSLARRLDFDAELSRQSVEASAPQVPPPPRGRRHAAIGVVAAVVALALVYAAYAGFLARPVAKNIDSVAVLPFANDTGDPDHEYLSDGISETLINHLSRLPELKVIARSSSFEYKGKIVNLQEVARALGVKAIVTGRVSQRGDMLIVGVELVDTAERTQLWGEQYNRKATDLLQAQAEISTDVAQNMRRRLSSGERDRLTKPETVNEQAYELALKARFAARQGGLQNRMKAIEYSQQAIALDPNYAFAYVGLSNGYRSLVGDSILDPKEFTPKADAALRKALELDDTLADAHVALGSSLRDRWEWTGAEREFQRAIAMNPSLASAHTNYARLLSDVGRHGEAIAEQTRSRELDPLSPIATTLIGYRLFFARRYDEAIETLKGELDKGHPLTPGTLGYAYAAKGMYKEAIAAYEEAIKRQDSTSNQVYLAAALAHAGELQRARRILEQLETTEKYVSPGELAILHAALGERDRAFASLEKAFGARDLQLQYLAIDPGFDSLRGDRRFADLLRRVGLPATPGAAVSAR